MPTPEENHYLTDEWAEFPASDIPPEDDMRTEDYLWGGPMVLISRKST